MNDKVRLEKAISNHVKLLFESALDYCEVAVPNDQYKRLRAKILRLGNNCIRNVKKDLRNYEIKYEEKEPVIEYKQPKYDERIIDDERSPIDNNERGDLEDSCQITTGELRIPKEWATDKK